MSECKQCPHVVGDSYQRDCAFPECIGWTITKNMKPIPDRQFDWDFSHNDYDGENGLCGNAASYDDAVKEIIEIMKEGEL